jgi:D-glycero-D-manno-heptose 1,7-bisphosphate phosphatase
MINEFKKLGIEISKVYHCPHHPDITGSCTCRKPKPGMLLDAAREFDIDLGGSIIIGDKERDIESGLNAGLSETYLFDLNNSIASSKATRIINNLEELIC